MLSIRSNLHESFLLLSIRHARSRFACIAISRILTSSGLYRVVEIVVNSIESTRMVSPVVDSSCWKSICKTRLRANRVEM